MCNMNSTILLLLSAGLAIAAERGEEIRLWPSAAPGSEGVTAAEVSKPSVNSKYGKLPGNFTVTHYPSIYVFLPAKEKATGAAMIVAPGGGHNQLVMEKEGWEFADWLNDRGIAAFVLKYRLARTAGSKYTLPMKCTPTPREVSAWSAAAPKSGESTRRESALLASRQAEKSAA